MPVRLVEDSYGFRPDRDAHQALTAILDAYQAGCWYVVDADIQACFDNLPHELSIDLVAKKVAAGNILYLLREFLTAEGQMADGSRQPVDRGTPQGGLISPLLANIVLHELDTRMIHAGFRGIRYADDFVVLCPSAPSAEQALALVTQIVAQLGRALSPEKTPITTFRQGFAFLDFCISVQTRSIRPKSVAKFKDRVRALTPRSHNRDQETITKLNRVRVGFAQ